LKEALEITEEERLSRKDISDEERGLFPSLFTMPKRFSSNPSFSFRALERSKPLWKSSL